MSALIAGPFLSYASMRARYCSTSAWQVSVPARIAAWMSAMVVSSTRKAGAAGACAMSIRETRERRIAARTDVRIGGWDQRRRASAASYMRAYAERAGVASFVVLNAAMIAALVAGLK